MKPNPATNPLISRYPLHVLREYALLADGERGALVGPRGDIVWLCAPRWDSDAVFAALIGGGGMYAITPVDARFVWGGSYEAGSLIWCSRWITEGGVIECHEALAVPADDERVVLLRTVRAIDTDARMEVHLDLRTAFGRKPLTGITCEHGVWTGRAGDLHMRWTGAQDAGPDGRQDTNPILSMELQLVSGQRHDFVLELSTKPLPAVPPAPEQAWRQTRQTWQSRVPEFPASLAPRDTRHAYAVLRGLTSNGGGMVASATMSLPERAEQGRNYDYRYVWIRDQCLAGEAIATAGALPLLDDAVRFVAARLLEDGPKLAPGYTIGGERVPDQQSLHLPGYPGGKDIRGNHVNAQFQLDAFGEALLLFAAAAGHGHLDADGWRAVEAAADAIAARWGEAEAGIWELGNRHWSESRLICVAGLRAVSRAPGAPRARGGDWLALAETLLADTTRHAVHPSGRWQRAPDDERLDAALLLPGIRGALPSGDPRTAATVAAVCKELDQDHYIYRFRQQPGRLGDAEGAFLLCGFAAALATHQLGQTGEALRYFERNRAACGSPGLLSEEYDVRQRQLRGNLPQAFVHAMLFEASVRLAKPWEPAP